MNKLYSVGFQRILNRMHCQDISIHNVQTVIQTNNIRPVGSFVYHRLCREEVRQFVKTPCPVQQVDSETSLQVISASKKMRRSFSVIEEKVCARCKFKDSCSHFNKQVSENTENVVPDILIFMQAMQNKSIYDNEIDFRVWKAGYKSCDSILAMIEDLSTGGSEAYEFQKLRLEYTEQKNEQAHQDVKQESEHLKTLHMEGKRNKNPIKMPSNAKAQKTGEKLDIYEQLSAQSRGRRNSSADGHKFNRSSIGENQEEGHKPNNYRKREYQRRQSQPRQFRQPMQRRETREGSYKNQFERDNRYQNDNRNRGYRSDRDQQGIGSRNEEYKSRSFANRNNPDRESFNKDRHFNNNENKYENKYGSKNENRFVRDREGQRQGAGEYKRGQNQRRQYQSEYQKNKRFDGQERTDDNGWIKREEPMSQRQKVQEAYPRVKNYKRDDAEEIFDRKFEKAGQNYKKPQIYQQWKDADEEQIFRPKNQPHAQARQQNAATFERPSLKQTQETSPKSEEPVRRGRNIKR